MLKPIQSEKYDVISNLVNEELIDMLKENNIDFNVIIFNPKKEEMRAPYTEEEVDTIVIPKITAKKAINTVSLIPSSIYSYLFS